MKTAFILLACLAVTGIAAMKVDQQDATRAAFEDFKRDYGRTYESAAEEAYRFKVFEQTLQRAEVQQRRNPNAKFGVNSLADRTEDEFRGRRGSRQAIIDGAESVWSNPHIQTRYRSPGNSSLPTSFDWRPKGAVTPIKNQGDCGSCWSFSTTGNIEGQWFLAGNPLVSLSEQELVSCDHVFAFGCHGSFSLFAFSWLINDRDGYLSANVNYPYVSGQGQVPACKPANNTGGARISGGKLLVPWDTENMMRFIVSEGPLSVAVDAASWQSYKGGVMTSCESLLPDHEVLVVGYGTANGIDYWIVKNSWGPGWGESGYIRIERAKNLCQIELLANSAKV